MKFCMSVASEINFPTILCMLDLKVLWRCYGNWSKGGVQIAKTSELPTKAQHFITSCHGKYIDSQHLLVLTNGHTMP